MNKILGAGAALLMTTGTASALGLDRSGQDITVLFEEGDHAELSFGFVDPNVDGEDGANGGGADSGNVAEDYTQFAFGYKQQVNDTFSLALILDQPYGVDIDYPAAPGGSAALGGTAATLDSTALSLIGRYHVNDRVSFHGGLRYQRLSAEVTLSGLAYGSPTGPLNGYNVQLDEDGEFGYVMGAAYERPDIALRVAVTYFSEIEYTLATSEFLGPNPVGSGDTEVVAPQAVNIDFQTGIAQDTLLFGQVRWAEYSKVVVAPDFFRPRGGSLTDIEDGYSYTLGIGRQFTDSFAGSISVNYEEEKDPLVSPLAPTNGSLSVTVGGAYTIDNVELSGGISYVSLGDGKPETSDTARADFTDNSAVGVGLKIATKF